MARKMMGVERGKAKSATAISRAISIRSFHLFKHFQPLDTVHNIKLVLGRDLIVASGSNI